MITILRLDCNKVCFYKNTLIKGVDTKNSAWGLRTKLGETYFLAVYDSKQIFVSSLLYETDFIRTNVIYTVGEI